MGAAPDVGAAPDADAAPDAGMGVIPDTGVTPRRAFGAVVPASVPAVIRGYKAAVTRAARLATCDPGLTVWQREYHDRVVRSVREADAVRRYIADNPARWIPPPHSPRSPFPIP